MRGKGGKISKVTVSMIPFKKACLLPYTESGLKHTMRSFTTRHFDGARNSLSIECWKSLRAVVVVAEPRFDSSAASPSPSCSSSTPSSSSSSLSSFSSFFDFLFLHPNIHGGYLRNKSQVIQQKYSSQVDFIIMGISKNFEVQTLALLPLHASNESTLLCCCPLLQ